MFWAGGVRGDVSAESLRGPAAREQIWRDEKKHERLLKAKGQVK